MITKYFQRNELSEAGEFLRSGECCAFPTETVYGLGANAIDPVAVGKIFTAKGRPSDNPLIVHIASAAELAPLVESIPEIAHPLIERFWPGPLTMVFPKSKIVPAVVTAGLETIAVRVPDHDWAIDLLTAARVPVAAPSANRSGRPSATTWEAVREDLDGKVAGVVCGPATEIGVESTVLDLSSTVPRLLRPGQISIDELRNYLPEIEDWSSLKNHSGDRKPNANGLNSPGLRYRHYQPQARVVLWDRESSSWEEFLLEKDLSTSRWAFIGTCQILASDKFDARNMAAVEIVEGSDVYARRLFDFFRSCDSRRIRTIICEVVPELGIGAALMDRLRRAAE